jgi:hypothetical protein
MANPAGRATNDPTNYFAIAQQSAKDVDGTTWYFTKHLGGSGFDVDPTVSSEYEGGAGREIGLRYRTKVTADGSFVAYARPDLAGRTGALALFQDTVVAGPSAATPSHGYFSTHSIFSGASIPLYFTAEQQWADVTERTGNCVVSSWKAEGEAGKPIKITTAFMSGGTPHSTFSPQVAVREAPFPLMYPGGSAAITFQGSGVGLGAASSVQITKWSVEAANKLDGDIQTNALNREDMILLTQDYNVNATIKYINAAAWEQIVYGGGSTVPTGPLANGAFTFYTQETGYRGVDPDLSSLQIFLPFVEAVQAPKVNRLEPDGATMYLDWAGASRQIGTSSLQLTVVSAASTSYALSTT